MVGMSKSGSRYGRRSNWFKIHCLLQEQQQQAAAAAAAAAVGNRKTPPPTSASINMLNQVRYSICLLICIINIFLRSKIIGKS